MNAQKRQMATGMVWIISMVLLAACSMKSVLPETAMDTPGHHYLMGMNLFEKGAYAEAKKEFERALGLSPAYAPAFVGLALVAMEQAGYEDAFAALEKAEDLAASDEDTVLALTARIRLNNKQQGEDWLALAEKAFSKAITLIPDDPAPYYYMATAYKTAQAYEKAAAHFKKVISLNKGLVEQADMGWDAVQRIQRAMPETELGRRLAGIEKVSRADVSALFIHELELEKLFRKLNVQMKAAPTDTENAPTDFQNHALRADIELVNHMGLRGLETIGNRFEPDREITRADFAVMIEDILIRITGEKGLSEKHISSASPFKDVDSSYYAFNAIVTCTTRGIMKANIKGYFKDMEPVPGADALLIVRSLKEALKQ